MTGWTLLNPLGLAALASLAVVGLIYFFYKRHTRRVVSGLFLFEGRVAWQKSGRRFARIRTGRSLILDLLACLLLSLALAGPAFLSAFGSHTVIVLDSSLSMRAANNYRKVKEQALDLVKEHGSGGNLTIIEGGRIPRITAASEETLEAYRRAVRDYEPFSSKQSLTEALSMARQSTTGDAVIHLFTDQNLTFKQSPRVQLTVHTFAGSMPNMAVTDAQRVRDDHQSEERIHLAVTNFSAKSGRGKLLLSTKQGLIAEAPLDLGPNDTVQQTYALPEKTGPVTISIEAPVEMDALKEDSRVQLMPAPDLTVTYRIAPTIGDTEYLERALNAAGAKLAVGREPPHLLITDSAMDEGSAITLELPVGAGSEAGFVGPFVVDRTHPLCREVELTGVYWVPAQDQVDDRGDDRLPEGSVVELITVGERPLYYQTAPNRLHLNLDPAASNIGRSPAWPVLIAGLVEKTREMLPGLHRVNYSGGDPLRYIVPKNAGPASRRLQGEGVDILWPSPHTPPRLPDRPGMYDVIENDTRIAFVSVTSVSPKESDLTRLAAEDKEEMIGSVKFGQGSPEQASSAWLLVLAALILLTLNWFLTRREL